MEEELMTMALISLRGMKVLLLARGMVGRMVTGLFSHAIIFGRWEHFPDL